VTVKSNKSQTKLADNNNITFHAPVVIQHPDGTEKIYAAANSVGDGVLADFDNPRTKPRQRVPGPITADWEPLPGLWSQPLPDLLSPGTVTEPSTTKQIYAVSVNNSQRALTAINWLSGSAQPQAPSFSVATSPDLLNIASNGGVIGVEFASAWKSFGADVTIVEALPHLVPLEDEANSKLLERAFRRRGIGFKLNSRFQRVEHTESGVRVFLEGGDTLEAEVLLVAVGRGPASANLGYEDVGIAIERGFVQVDEYLRTNVPGVYAVGDVVSMGPTPHPQLAHVGFGEGILVAEHIAGLPVVPIDYAGVPRITYSSPEVASVGLTEVQAVEKHGAEAIKTVTYDLSGNGRSSILQTKGAVKLVARVDGPVLGVHIVGDRVGELIAEAQLIYNWEALPSEVAQLIHPHPTQSEAIGEAHMLLAGKPLHVHE